MKPKHNISAERAIELILDHKSLIDYYICGDLDLYNIRDKLSSNYTLTIENCIIKSLNCSGLNFQNQVKLIHSFFDNCSFHSAYFISGLLINGCTFDNYLDFEAGGHNKEGTNFTLINSNFKSFVNFFDCWFQSEVIINNNNFQMGTNLLGFKGLPYEVTFEVDPIIEDNIGILNHDHEGGRTDNIIDIR